MDQRKKCFFIFKFTLYISRIAINANFRTSVKVIWRTQHSQGITEQPIYELVDGKAKIESEITLEQVMKMDLERHVLESKQSTLYVFFVSNGQMQKAGSCTIDLASLTSSDNFNSVSTYSLRECIDQDATISYGIVHASSFEVDQVEVASFQTLSRQASQRKINEEEMPPVFGTRINNLMGSMNNEPEIQIIRPSVKNPSRARSKKSISPADRSMIAQRHAEEYEKFMKIIDAKDQLIQELQAKIEQLLQNRRMLQNRCTSLEQELRDIQVNYKNVVNTHDRYANTRKGLDSQAQFEVPYVRQRDRSKSSSDYGDIIMRYQKKRSQIDTQHRPDMIVKNANKSSRSLKHTDRSRSKQQLEHKPTKQEQYLKSLTKTLQEQLVAMENDNKFLRQEAQRNKKFQKQQEEMIRVMASRVQAIHASTEGRQNSMQQSLIAHLETIQRIQRQEQLAAQKRQSEIEIEKSHRRKNSQKKLQFNMVDVKQYEKLKKQSKQELQEMEHTLFAQKKKNILLQEQVNRLKSELKKSQQEFKSNYKKSSMEESLIEMRNKELRNELQELKRGSPTKERSTVNQQRYKVIEEELKLKISSMKEQFDQKQLQYKNTMQQKQIQIITLKDQLTVTTNQKLGLEKKLESLTEAISQEKERSQTNEKKALTYDRLQKKFAQLQKFNKEIQNDFEKAELDRKNKGVEIGELKGKLQQRDLEWTRLKRLETDYKNLQDSFQKLQTINDNKEKRLEDLQRKTSKLRETMLKDSGNRGVYEQRLKELQQKFKQKDVPEQVSRMEKERKFLKQQSQRLNEQVKQLEKELETGKAKLTESMVGKLAEQKSKLQKKITEQINTKLKAIQTKIEKSRQKQVALSTYMTRSRNQFQLNRMKMLQTENEQIRAYTKILTKKLLQIEKIGQERINASEYLYSLKMKQKQFREKEDQFEKQVNDANDVELSKESIDLDKSQRSDKADRSMERRTLLRQNIEKIKATYVRRIEFLKQEIAGYQKRQYQLFQKEKEISMRQVKADAAQQSKKLLRMYESNNAQVTYLKERAKRLQEIEPQYKQLKEKVQKFDMMKASIVSKKTEYEQNIMNEYQKRDKESRSKIHKLELDLQKMKFQKDNQKGQLEKELKQHKKVLNDVKEGYEKLKKVSKQEISQLTGELKLHSQQAATFKKTMQQNCDVLIAQMDKRDTDIKNKAAQIQYLTGKIDEISRLFQNNLTISAQQLQKLTFVNGQNNQLREIVMFREQQNMQLKLDIERLNQDTQELYNQQKLKYEQLDTNNKKQIELMQQEINRLQSVIEDEVKKFIEQQALIEQLKSQLVTYQQSIEELYASEMANQNTINELKELQKQQYEQQRIVEEEYEKILKDLGKQTIQFMQFKNKYVSLQKMLSKSEEFIANLQKNIQDNNNKFQDVLRDQEEKKKKLIKQVEEIRHMAERKDKEFEEYSKTMTQREKQYRQHLEDAEIKMNKMLGQLAQAQRNSITLNGQIGRLKEEIESLRDPKNDKKKKKMLQPEVSNVKEGKKGRDQVSRIDNKSCIAPSVPPSPLPQIHRQPEYPQSMNSLIPQISTQQPEKFKPSEISLKSHFADMKSEYEEIEQPKINVLRPQQLEFHEEVHMILPLSPINKQKVQKADDNNSPMQIMKDYEASDHQRQDSHNSEESERQQDETQKKIKQQQFKIKQLEAQLEEKITLSADLQKDKNRYKQILEMHIAKKAKIMPDGSMVPIQQDQEQKMKKLVFEVAQLKILLADSQRSSTKHFEDKQRYAASIELINEQFQELHEEKELLSENLKQCKRQLKIMNEKELQFLEDQRNAAQLLQEKQRTIGQFELIIKNYTEQKDNLQRMLRDLQKQYEDKVFSQKSIKQELFRLEKQIQQKDNTVSTLASTKHDLEQRLQAISCQFTSCQSTKLAEVNSLQNELVEAKSLVKNKELSLHDIAQKYVDLEEDLNKNSENFKTLQMRLQEKSHKYEQSLLKISTLQKEINLAALSRKDLESRIQALLRDNKAKDNEKAKVYNQFLAEMRRMQQQKQAIGKQLSAKDCQLEQQDLECYAIKKDLEVFNMENRQLRKENEQLSKKIQDSQEQLKSIIINYEQEIKRFKSQEQILMTRIRQLEDLIVQYQQSAEELQRIDRIRQEMFHELDRKYKIIENQNKNIEESLTKQLNIKLVQAVQEVAEKSQDDIKKSKEQTKFLKDLCDQLQFEMEQERANIFNKECQFQKLSYEYEDERRRYQQKIRRYEIQVSNLAEKFKKVQKQRPTIELYEQLAFQNEIFKNRINQLEQTGSYRKIMGQSELKQDFELYKMKKQRQKQELMAQLDNYSQQVNDLEQRNYILTKELEMIRTTDFSRIEQIEEQNLRMEKQLIRLEHVEEELTKQIKILKTKREEDMKKHYNELRAARQK